MSGHFFPSAVIGGPGISGRGLYFRGNCPLLVTSSYSISLSTSSLSTSEPVYLSIVSLRVYPRGGAQHASRMCFREFKQIQI